MRAIPSKTSRCLSWRLRSMALFVRVSIDRYRPKLHVSQSPDLRHHRYPRTPLPRSTFSLFLLAQVSLFFIFLTFALTLSLPSPLPTSPAPAVPSQSNGRFLLAPNGTIPSRARGVIPRIKVQSCGWAAQPGPGQLPAFLFCHPCQPRNLPTLLGHLPIDNPQPLRSLLSP
ncbi:hypothetical protein BDP81DRAFT_146044 [Colletotrichum phormii]|uniref:Uncharacterized protein n=1 Tax=Colletotrichum phormii TaxID=359342 RepID=A0AAI9ZDC9_9PEZI|nr:uncharacterized protein BDP81DRAFT_146044 [Colletotrichum phormii]KAK1622445.1 hypothetical protein BDP81DRAFT_146044 [Colletotrichum phormii]